MFAVGENVSGASGHLMTVTGNSVPIAMSVVTNNSNSGAAIFKQDATSKQFWAAPGLYSAYSPSGGGKYYFVDGAGPFTGCHDAFIDKNLNPELGDILTDVSMFYKHDISNTLSIVTTSSTSFSKKVIGVVSALLPIQKSTPGCLWEPYDVYNEEGAVVNTDLKLVEGFNLEDLQAQYKVVQINALGEGLINVCGENGNIEIGDLIVTSSIPGKGMKQSDDIIRNITVAKARENVTFNSPTEIKQIACIYLAG